MEAIKKRFVIEWPHFLQTEFQQHQRLNGAIAFCDSFIQKTLADISFHLN